MNFADDNFCVIWNKDLTKLEGDLEKELEMVTKWVKYSGLIVNEAKTEICLFHAKDQPCINVRLFNVVVTSLKSMVCWGLLSIVN